MGKVKPQEALHIDENQLDVEWCAQPNLYFDYAAKLADAKRDLEHAKNVLEVTKAETAMAIRTDPKTYGIEKMSESALEKVLPLQQQVIDAQEDLVGCRHAVDMNSAMVSALDHRRKALEKLVDLFLASYYAKPRASSESNEVMEAVEKDASRRRGRKR